MYVYKFEDSMMKLFKHCLKKRREKGKWEYNEVAELTESTLNAYGELPQ
jgi:hypothetical protein